MTTGSTAVFEKHLGALVKYIDSLAERLKQSGMARNGLGHYGTAVAFGCLSHLIFPYKTFEYLPRQARDKT